MELVDLTRIFFALIAVLGMIGLAAFAARKAGLSTGRVSFSPHKRLSTVETMALDARRRVAIIKCDGREHLILLSATGETIVDRDLPAPPMQNDEAQNPPAATFGEAMKKLQALGRGTNPFAERYAQNKSGDEETKAA